MIFNGNTEWLAERMHCAGPLPSWELSLRVPHFDTSGFLRRWMSAPAVVDDFGNLVVVGAWS